MIVRSAAKALAVRTAGIAAANPSATLGSFLFLIAFALVASNALMAQPGLHPDPIWMTRDTIVTKAITPTRKVELARKPFLVKPVSLKDVPIPTFKSALKTEPPVRGHSPLVEEIQKELTILNLYHGEVDGLYGANTKQAISQLQSIIGLQANGVASQDLLDLLRSRGDVSDSNRREPAQADASDRSHLVREIQRGLSQLGPDKLDVDGIYGRQTAQAIRSFQETHQLKVDGQPSDAVLDKLIQVGALKGT